jgi:hypothetical protein
MLEYSKLPKRNGQLELSLSLLDAVVSRTRSTFHNRIARLPITFITTPITDDASGNKRVETTISVKGRPKLRIVEYAPIATSTAPGTPKTLSFSMDDELPCYEDCGGDPVWWTEGDHIATPAERNDVLAMVAAIAYDVETAETDLTTEYAAFDAWYQVNGDAPALGGISTPGRGSLTLSFSRPANPCAEQILNFLGAYSAFEVGAFGVAAAVLLPEAGAVSLLAGAIGVVSGGSWTLSAGIGLKNCMESHRPHGGGASW